MLVLVFFLPFPKFFFTSNLSSNLYTKLQIDKNPTL
jgi:hypothetical protein